MFDIRHRVRSADVRPRRPTDKTKRRSKKKKLNEPRVKKFRWIEMRNYSAQLVKFRIFSSSSSSTIFFACQVQCGRSEFEWLAANLPAVKTTTHLRAFPAFSSDTIYTQRSRNSPDDPKKFSCSSSLVKMGGQQIHFTWKQNFKSNNNEPALKPKHLLISTNFHTARRIDNRDFTLGNYLIIANEKIFLETFFDCNGRLRENNKWILSRIRSRNEREFPDFFAPVGIPRRSRRLIIVNSSPTKTRCSQQCSINGA